MALVMSSSKPREEQRERELLSMEPLHFDQSSPIGSRARVSRRVCEQASPAPISKSNLIEIVN